MRVFANDRSSHCRSVHCRSSHGRSERERSSPQSATPRHLRLRAICDSARSKSPPQAELAAGARPKVAVRRTFFDWCFLLFFNLLFFVVFVVFCCVLLLFVAFCCFLLANKHVGAKITLLPVKTTRLEAPDIFSFVCCVVVGAQKCGNKKQNFTGQNSNLSGVCGRLCSLLCGVATNMWEQAADFCQTNLGK